MAALDIRNTDEEITEIQFSDEEHLSNLNAAIIEISQKCECSNNKLRIFKRDIPNLIKALDKAKELGWY